MNRIKLAGLLMATHLCFFAAAQQDRPGPAINDGPYIFIRPEGLVAQWIAAGELRQDTLQPGKALSLEPGVSAAFDASCLRFDAPLFTAPTQTRFKGVSKIAVIGDPHGQFDVVNRLLQTHLIIDSAQNWMYGDGHLVFLGDFMDRGPQVQDLFWLALKLEQQAERAGGKVHFLLGNHEHMILEGDLRYLHPKYRFTMAKMGLPYEQLYGPDTYIGQWLRTRPVAFSINSIVFVHAGFSEEVMSLGLSLEEINALFREQILDRSEEEIAAKLPTALLDSEWGPLWYRGYFEESFTQEKVQQILSALRAKRIVVGHTSFPTIETRFKGKVIAADSSIKTGQQGELLFLSKKHRLRGTLDGSLIELK
jgi:hypothetical protein